MSNIRSGSRPSLLLAAAAVVIIIGATILSVIYTDIIYFNAGFTVVLVLITAWYSTTLYHESTRSEKSRTGRVIAEIARSIFSAMRNDLEGIEYQLRSGGYLQSLKPITIRDFVLQPPSHYLNDDITISPQNAPIRTDAFSGSVQRPAPYLLSIPDEILRKEHLPIIQELCRDYDKDIPRLLSTVEDLCLKIPPIWQGFKGYCLSIDQHSLHEFLPKNNPSTPSETYFCTLLRAVISEADLSGIGYAEYTDDRAVMRSAKSDAFKAYYAENKDTLRDWLERNGLQKDIEEHKRVKQNLRGIINKLDTEINSLFLAWKMEYYLTEDEMNVQTFRGP